MKVESVKINWIIDEYPDISYLESSIKNGVVDSCRYTQEDYEEDPEQVKQWIRQDTQRLNSYGDDWVNYGCMAEAVVSYPISKQGDRRLETLTSGGLWGIESDSDDSYKTEIAKEQIEELKDHLKRFNIRINNKVERLMAEAVESMKSS